MTNATNDKVKVLRKDLISRISQNTALSKVKVRQVLDTYADMITVAVSNVPKNKELRIELFEGLYLDCNYLESKKKVNNFTGDIVKVKDKVKLKLHITSNFKSKYLIKDN